MTTQAYGFTTQAPGSQLIDNLFSLGAEHLLKGDSYA
jgi:hypothetical protein